MELTQLADISIPIIGLLASAKLSYQFKLIGLFSGVIVFWLLVFLRLEVLMYLEPDYTPGITGSLHVYFGGFIGLVWCSIFFIAALFKQRKVHKQSSGEKAT